MTRSRQTADWGSRAGLAKIVPSSVAVGSGTGSADSLGSVTFTGVSSVSLNDVFSSAYDHYRIILRLTAAAADIGGINFRFRVSGADNSTSNYNKVGWYVGSDASSGNGNSLSQTQFPMGTFDTTAPTYHLHDILVSLPFNTDYTQFQDISGYKNQGGTHFSEYNSNWFNATTSFTGFSIFPASSTITGTVRVYGFN
jgi:hypothetical protein